MEENDGYHCVWNAAVGGIVHWTPSTSRPFWGIDDVFTLEEEREVVALLPLSVVKLLYVGWVVGEGTDTFYLSRQVFQGLEGGACWTSLQYAFDTCGEAAPPRVCAILTSKGAPPAIAS